MLCMLSLPMTVFMGSMVTSCSDKMDDSNYYTFTGKMMSEYLKENQNLSLFSQIVEKAGMMDQLSAYGHYTCFAPTNDAINDYLVNEKKKSIDQLTQADCDTIARTHLVGAMYSTNDLATYVKRSETGEAMSGILGTQNMMRRNLYVTVKKNEQSVTEYIINNKSVVDFTLQDDSVENGIVQQINKVIVNSTSTISNLIKDNTAAQGTTTQIGQKCAIYYEALKRTGLEQHMDTMVEDFSYNYKDYPEFKQYDTGAEKAERAIAPKTRKYGFTVFLCPDDVLAKKYGINSVEDLYNKACEIYDPQHTYAGTLSDALNDKENPLYQFMAYHVLNRNVQAYEELTVKQDMGVASKFANATEWYPAMLDGSIMKVEHLICKDYLEGANEKDYYINRRVDNKFKALTGIRGTRVIQPTETIDAVNGLYFYLDDILKYDHTTRNVVCAARMRMDMATLFPEIVNNSMRMNGDCKSNGSAERLNTTNEAIGFNYYFPNMTNGKNYLEGVVLQGSEANFVYRRPRLQFLSMYGDEMVANGIFDVTFNLPPFPFEGQWQIRLGFAAMDNAPRGVVEIYFDGESTGIPINMEKLINSPEIYGTAKFPAYNDIRDNAEERAQDYKILKSKGYYRGPYSIFLNGSGNEESSGTKFATMSTTIRKVLCTVNIQASDLKKVHTLRIRNRTPSNADPRHKEGMFDYLEFVPSSVYGIGENGEIEDDL